MNTKPLTRTEITDIYEIMDGRSYLILHNGSDNRAYFNRNGMTLAEAECLLEKSLNLLRNRPDRVSIIDYGEGSSHDRA